MSNIIAVTSGKGGVGKSTVSAGLGQALAKKGKTVLILELDAGLRGLDIMLGAENSVVYDLGDLLSGDCSMSDAIVPMEQYPGLSLIAASASAVERYSIDMLLALCRDLREQFDTVIIDMPAGISMSGSIIPQAAELALIVATPDPVSVRDSNRMVSLLAAEGFRNCRLVINRVDTKYRKRNPISDLDDVLDGVGIPLIGVIPEDSGIKTAFTSGMKPEEGSISDIVFQKIATRIEGEYTPLYIV